MRGVASAGPGVSGPAGGGRKALAVHLPARALFLQRRAARPVKARRVAYTLLPMVPALAKSTLWLLFPYD
jgi:hypothetical protein